jgi:hypothetical protein
MKTFLLVFYFFVSFSGVGHAMENDGWAEENNISIQVKKNPFKRLNETSQLLESQPAVWEVTHPNYPGKIFYLMGTIHALIKEDNYSIPDELVTFITKMCKTVYFESCTENVSEDKEEILEQERAKDLEIVMPEDQGALFEGIHNYQDSLERIIKESSSNLPVEDLEKLNVFLESLDQDSSLESSKTENMVDFFDSITHEIFMTFLQVVKNDKHFQKLTSPGTEVILKQKICHKNKIFCFEDLETIEDILKGLKERVIANSPNQEDVTPWLNALDVFRQDSCSDNLPSFFTSTLMEALFMAREGRWLPIMKEAFLASDNQGNATLFAVGGLHLKNIVPQLEAEKYFIRKIG